ncbi:MAG: hypothetical protein MZV63_11655 [Marinilabiliales bacterium]|nr:hypothetical protein [Marinilabiliales bacterium]
MQPGNGTGVDTELVISSLKRVENRLVVIGNPDTLHCLGKFIFVEAAGERNPSPVTFVS